MEEHNKMSLSQEQREALYLLGNEVAKNMPELGIPMDEIKVCPVLYTY
jgi:hypothetical protein